VPTSHARHHRRAWEHGNREGKQGWWWPDRPARLPSRRVPICCCISRVSHSLAERRVKVKCTYAKRTSKRRRERRASLVTRWFVLLLFHLQPGTSVSTRTRPSSWGGGRRSVGEQAPGFNERLGRGGEVRWCWSAGVVISTDRGLRGCNAGRAKRQDSKKNGGLRKSPGEVAQRQPRRRSRHLIGPEHVPRPHETRD